MLGFVVGFFCLFALIKMHHMRRMAWAYGWGHRHGWRGPHGRWGHGPGGPFGGPFGGRRRGLYALFEALDATPAQEKVILEAVAEVKQSLRDGRGELRQSREDLARAFRADSFDAEIMGNAFARHDEHLERVRKAVTGALARVHDALEDKQRARLAEWLDSSGGFGPFTGFGPYR